MSDDHRDTCECPTCVRRRDAEIERLTENIKLITEQMEAVINEQAAEIEELRKTRTMMEKVYQEQQAEIERLRAMMTIGNTIDKLTIANIRLWHLEDRRRDHRLSDEERLAAADTVAEVNVQRNNLIDEIDRLIDGAIKDGHALRDPKHKLYGHLHSKGRSD